MMTIRPKDLLRGFHGRVVMRLAVGAIVSGSLSTLLAAFSGKLFRQDLSHMLFIVGVAMISLALGGTRLGLRRVDAGFVLVLILFEPIGPVLLRREPAPSYFFAALPLALAAAYFFGREGGSGSSNGTT